MGTKINKELFISHLKDKYGDKVELISEYHGKERPVEILYHCEKHGDTTKWLNAKNIFGLNFNPCKECFKESHSKKNRPIQNKEFYYEKLKLCCEEHNGILIETEWTTAKDTYHFKCDNPDHPVFENTADGIMNKHQWCPYCSGRKGDFDKRIDAIVKEKGGEVISPYKSSQEYMKIRCIKHNYIWDITPCNILKGRWCPICKMSINEKVPLDWFNNNSFNVIPQYKFDGFVGKDGNPYKYDFGLLDNNNDILCMVEIDDETHRGNSEKYAEGRKRDIIKNNYCKEHNIPLYRVPIDRSKISRKGYDWYYNYIDEQLGFLRKE